MQARMFRTVTTIGESSKAPSDSTGTTSAELSNWLRANQNIEIVHSVQSQSFEPPTERYVGRLIVVTTIFFRIKPKRS